MKLLSLEVVLAIHDSQLARHGGLPGVRDRNLLESALARPRQREAYGESDFHRLAASLAYGLARNHPFADGNKRTAWTSARAFLALNGINLRPDPAAAVEMMVALAEGRLSEDDFAGWLRDQPAAPPR